MVFVHKVLMLSKKTTTCPKQSVLGRKAVISWIKQYPRIFRDFWRKERGNL